MTLANGIGISKIIIYCLKYVRLKEACFEISMIKFDGGEKAEMYVGIYK